MLILVGAGSAQGFLQSNEVHIFGYARTKISDDELRNRIRGYDLLNLCFYVSLCLFSYD